MKNFIIKLFIFSVIIAIADYCWIRFMPIANHIPHVWMVLAFFVLLTLVFHWLTLSRAKGDGKKFIRYYMGSTALRMFLLILIIVVYRFQFKDTVKPFALGFMVHYLVFTVFEVSTLLKQLRKP